MSFIQHNESDPHGKAPDQPGAKLDNGKLQAWLFMSGFPRALEAVADVTTKGAIKYSRNGWMTVPGGIWRYMEAFGRHLLDMAKGKVFDDGPKGTGCRHKAQMIWNLLASLELELREEEELMRKEQQGKSPKALEPFPPLPLTGSDWLQKLDQQTRYAVDQLSQARSSRSLETRIDPTEPHQPN